MSCRSVVVTGEHDSSGRRVTSPASSSIGDPGVGEVSGALSAAVRAGRRRWRRRCRCRWSGRRVVAGSVVPSLMPRRGRRCVCCPGTRSAIRHGSGWSARVPSVFMMNRSEVLIGLARVPVAVAVEDDPLAVGRQYRRGFASAVSVRRRGFLPSGIDQVVLAGLNAGMSWDGRGVVVNARADHQRELVIVVRARRLSQHGD